MKNQLVCTFTTRKQYNTLIDTIIDNYTLVHDKIYVLSTDTPYETVCSYNIQTGPNTEILSNSITVHRKGGTNTMFTVNALNLIIESETGTRNPNHQIDWTRFKNSLLVTERGELKVIPTRLFLVERIR